MGRPVFGLLVILFWLHPTVLIGGNPSPLTLEQEVGLLFWKGVRQLTLTPPLSTAVREGHIGGIFLTGGPHPEAKARAFFRRLQAIRASNSSLPPLYIGLDEEGRRVRRIATQTFTPNLHELAALGSPYLTYLHGVLTGQRLRGLGVVINFGPVLDVISPDSKTVLLRRSISDDPDEVARYGRAYVNGIQSTGLLACIKHFPGHGAVLTDTHHHEAKSSVLPGQFERRHLSPFVRVLPRANAVMLSHVIYPQFDARYPASLSEKIGKELLHDDLRFNGLVITDDLSMAAVSSFRNRAILAFRAGAHVLLSSASFETLKRHRQRLLTLATTSPAFRRALHKRTQAREKHLNTAPKSAPIEGETMFYQDLGQWIQTL